MSAFLTVAMRRWDWILLLLVVVGLSLAIVGSTTYFPMNDAPNHIATAVIAHELLQGDAYFAAHYRFLPVPLPYWATTLLMLPLIPLVGALKAFGLVIAFYVVALPVSFYLLMRIAAPDNVPLTAVAALAAFNWAYWLGEANFLLGQPAVLLALAFFLRIPAWGAPAVVAFLAAAAAAYACHIFAIATLLVTIGALTLLSLASRFDLHLERWRFVRAQWRIVASVVILFAAGAYFVVFQRGTSSYLHTGHANYGMFFDLRLRKLAKLATDPFGSPTISSPWPAFGFSMLVALVLLVSAYAHAREAPRSPWRFLDAVNPALLAPAAAVTALFYLAPVRTVREGEIGQRFVLIGFLLLLGAVRLGQSRWRGSVLAVAVAIFAVFKLGDARRLHRDYDAGVSDLSRDVLARVPERSRVLPIQDLTATSAVQYLYHRLANYVVVERHGYSPTIPATPGQQPLRHVRPYVSPQGQRSAHRTVADKAVEESDWDYYDYVLVQSDRSRPEVAGLAERTSLVADVRGFRLYRVDRSAAATAER